MSTIKNDNFDYKTYAEQHPPDPSHIHRGKANREKRLEEALKKSMIYVEEDILQQFKLLVSEKKDRDQLINQALREWLTARGIKELVREELENIIEKKFPGETKKANL